MPTLHSLYQANLHKISVGPHDESVSMLVGSDIVLHLPVLKFLASQVDWVVEFGVRNGDSTTAFLSGARVGVVSVDIERTPIVDVLESIPLSCSWTFIQSSSTGPLGFAFTDLIFFDTMHTYSQLSAELKEHGRKARKYLVFHDTFTCDKFDVSGPDPSAEGIGRAIKEFMAQYAGDYNTIYQTEASNGLLVLERLS